MAPRSERTYQFGPFLLNAAERVLLREGEPVHLTPKAFETLLVLVENAGHTVQKETLIKRVWPDAFVQEDNLTFNISALRKALGDHPGGQQYVQTEHKVGYRFVAPVKTLEPGSEPTQSLTSRSLAGTPSPGLPPDEVHRDGGPPSPPRGRGEDRAKERATADNQQLGTDPLTRPAPAEENAGGGPPSPPGGRGERPGLGRGEDLAKERATAGNEQLGVDPLTRPAPAEENAGGAPPSPPGGRGADFGSGRGERPRLGRGEDIEGGVAAGSGAALQRVRRAAMWAGVGLALLIVATVAVWLAAPRPEPKTLKCDQITADGREKGGGLATDGERVYFIEQASTGWVIAQVSAYGGDPAAIATTLADSSVTDISPDHKELLVVEGREFGPGTLKLVPLLGGEPRPLGNLHAYSASWSPDGSAMAYTTEGGLYLCAPDGSNSRQIVNKSGLLIDLHWSPDGRRLCFTRSEHSQVSLWEVDRDGGGLICLFPGLLSNLTASHGLWAPNGEYLIADSFCAGRYRPSAARLPSGPFSRHWGQPACLESGPLDISVSAISPDGSRLFGLANMARHSQMEQYDTQSRLFKPFLPSISCGYADFSKDGQRIAYVAGEQEITGPSCLWVSQIDGSHKVQLTKPPLLTMLPRWSPDGKWIAFMGKDPGQPWRVRVVSVDGGSYAPVTAVNDEEGAPTWSPDGAQIAFGGMTQASERTSGPLVIHILNLKTGQLTQVPGSDGLWTARWSPDGRYIAAVTEDNHKLMLFDFRTTRWTKLASIANILDVTWSRHEEALYFNGDVSAGERAIYGVKIPGGRLERLASLTGRSEWHWLGLAPDDSPLIAHQAVTREIYALTVKWP